MSTVKISALPKISTFAGANTGNILFLGVDLSTNVTGQINGTALANNLYLNNNLVVGNNVISLPNTIAQFSGVVNSYMQINAQNFNPYGTTDLVLTADNGTNSNSFVDLGINNSQYNGSSQGQSSQSAYDGYLIVQGPGNIANSGNLILGTANVGTNTIFAVGGYQANNIVAWMTANGLVLNTQSFIVFADGTSLTTANGINSAASFANGAFTKANTAVQNTATIVLNNLTLAGNLIYGSNATVTGIQTGSRTSLVYANGSSGVIVAYNASSFQHGTSYVFTVNNSSILHASDIVITTVQSTNCPVLQATTANTRVGSFDILVTNGGGAGNDAAYTMNLNFGIIRVGS